ncbi:unnamed protein product [Moneuplotes crassus]|uniref:Uncharacterized protein n=1 Tax=Euplotes crassus TaxID=5936 RepID=A0AAD1XEP8_EUPCR|nr:unnamed protein product [Moneuplotes crassus]
MGSAPSKPEDSTSRRTIVAIAGLSALLAGGYICYRYGIFSKENKMKQKVKSKPIRKVQEEEKTAKSIAKNESSQGQGAEKVQDSIAKAGKERQPKESSQKDLDTEVKTKEDSELAKVLKNFEETMTKAQKEFCDKECAILIKELDKSKDGFVEEIKHLNKDDILKMLKVTGRLGKSRSKIARHKNQDLRAGLIKSSPDLYFSYAVKAIIEEENLYNESIDYVLQRIGITPEEFFNVQSVYMNNAQFCEALTKIDMETLPIEEEGEEIKEVEKIPKKACKNMLKQLYKDAEKIFDSIYKQRVDDTNMKELSPVLFETIANDLMFAKNNYRMDDILKIASSCNLMDDKEFMDYIQKFQNKLLASIVEKEDPQVLAA